MIYNEKQIKVIVLAERHADDDIRLYDVAIGNQLCRARESISNAFVLIDNIEDSQALLTHIHRQMQELLNTIME